LPEEVPNIFKLPAPMLNAESPVYVNPLKFCWIVSLSGADAFGRESMGKASVKTGSKFEVSVSDSCKGTKTKRDHFKST
jgi:hypothetical protein